MSDGLMYKHELRQSMEEVNPFNYLAVNNFSWRQFEGWVQRLGCFPIKTTLLYISMTCNLTCFALCLNKIYDAAKFGSYLIHCIRDLVVTSNDNHWIIPIKIWGLFTWLNQDDRMNMTKCIWPWTWHNHEHDQRWIDTGKKYYKLVHESMV